MTTIKTKSAFVAIVGRPNVGKSTLLNSMVGEKVAIVSNRPQTTRTRITGILTKGDTQLVFLDTPGWHQSQNKLSDYMIKQIKESMSDVEVALLLTDPVSKIQAEEIELLENLKLRKIPVILIINKIDKLEHKELMMPKISEFSSLYDFDEIVPISAIKSEGVDALLNIIEKYAKTGPHFFDSDDYTDQPERVIIAEIVREKLLRNLREELPHGIAVGVEMMKERTNKDLVDIYVNIICERANHKGMIIGKNGTMLKTIASESRSDIEKFLNCKVNLQCWVKVKEDWRNRENLMKQFGFN